MLLKTFNEGQKREHEYTEWCVAAFNYFLQGKLIKYYHDNVKQKLGGIQIKYKDTIFSYKCSKEF